MKTIADLKFENAALYEANRILAERLQLVESDKKRNPPLRQEFFDLKKTLDQTRSALWKAEGGGDQHNYSVLKIAAPGAEARTD